MESDHATPGAPNSRREEARRTLLAAARRLFASKGYGDTTVDEIVLAAAVSRGAFYFEFEDKQELFRTILEDEQRDVHRRMEEVLGDKALDPFDTLGALARAFLEAVSDRSVRRIVFVDGPVVLGRQDWSELNRQYPLACLEMGLRRAMKMRAIEPLPVGALVSVLGAALTEAAMVLEAGDGRANVEDLLRVFGCLCSGLRGAGGDMEDAGGLEDAGGPEGFGETEDSSDTENTADTEDAGDIEEVPVTEDDGGAEDAAAGATT